MSKSSSPPRIYITPFLPVDVVLSSRWCLQYGDGWNGDASLSFVNVDTKEVLYAGLALPNGREVSFSLCDLLGCGCYTGQATAGSYPVENSWDVTTADATTIIAQATGDVASTFCLVDDCLSCGAGSYSNSDGTAWELCPKGRYNDDAGTSSACFMCGGGKYNGNSGGTSVSDCLDCGLGKFSTARSDSCTDCGPGTYGPNANNSECTECGGGKYNGNSGATSASDCLDCGLGKFSTARSDSCTDCGPGTFAAFGGMPSCSFCKANSYSTNTGSRSEEDCVNCSLGEYGDSTLGKCLACSSASGNPCIIALTQDLNAAYDLAARNDTIVITTGTTFVGGDGSCISISGKSSLICITKKIEVKCSDNDEKCTLSGLNERRIMHVGISESQTLSGVTLEGLYFVFGMVSRNPMKLHDCLTLKIQNQSKLTPLASL